MSNMIKAEVNSADGANMEEVGSEAPIATTAPSIRETGFRVNKDGSLSRPGEEPLDND